MKGRTNMRQIAEAAGVSVATVSMALRNSERITPETREKVRAIATEMNYRPDPLIAARPPPPGSPCSMTASMSSQASRSWSVST